MRKFILFLSIVSLTFTSCSKDDSEDQSKTDPIIGKWKVIEQIYDGENIEIEECTAKEIAEFKSDGTLLVENYKKKEDSCEFDEIFGGTWKNQGNGKYIFDIEGDMEQHNITFSGNKMTIIPDEEPTAKLIFQKQ